MHVNTQTHAKRRPVCDHGFTTYKMRLIEKDKCVHLAASTGNTRDCKYYM